MSLFKSGKGTYKQFFFLLRIGITLVLLYIIFKKIDFSNTIEVIRDSNKFYLLPALISVSSFHLLSVYRWKFALMQNNVRIKFFRLLRFHFTSIFLQNFLPSGISGDLIKGVLAFKGNPKIRVASSIIISRLFGLFALIILANIALFSLSSKSIIVHRLRWYAFGLLLVVILIYIVIFNRKIQELCIKIYNSIHLKILKRIEIRVLFEKFNSYKNIKIVLVLFLISFSMQIVTVFSNYFIFRSVINSINIIYLFLYVPIIMFVSLLPISLNGYGIREGLYYYFFRNIISSDSIIFAFIILSLLMIISFSLIGGVLIVFGFKSKRKD